MKHKNGEDAALARMRDAWQRSGLSLAEVGRKMGYKDDTAKKAVWQLLHKTPDPRLSAVRRFAKALALEICELVGT